MLTLVLFMSFFIQDPIPYKPAEEFDLKLNFEFKDRSSGRDANKIDMDMSPKEYQKKNSTGVLPYLHLNLRVLTLQANEMRVKVIENGNRNVLNKKFDPSTVLKLDCGFTDDIKDRVGPYEYTVVFLNEDKDPVSRIVIYFEKDGTYLVNGQNRGKI